VYYAFEALFFGIIALVLIGMGWALWSHPADRVSLGGFNWSSQHLVMEVLRNECWQASAGDSCDAWPSVVAGPAVGRAA
jgi:hypothetical protein